MGKCIFCNKQTNNEYSYYVADKSDGVREKITVFTCTKCFKKTGVITLSIIFLFFLLSLIGNVMKSEEMGPVISGIIIVLLLLLWTFYIAHGIKTDKPLSETTAAKKLIGKAKKVYPEKFYFTPTENALLPVKHEEENPVLILYKEINSGKDIDVEVITTASIKQLIRLYGSTPKGEGFLAGSKAAEQVRMVGELLDKVGGFQLMLAVHKQFATSYYVYGAARNLEMVWNGIGGWKG